MHPLFKSRSAMAAYASLWVVLALLLAALLRLAGSATWAEALLLSGPPCVFYAFMCLTPWYVCRALPLSSAVWRLAVNHVGAAVLACALWIGAARGVASVFGLDTQLQPAIPHLIAVGFLLYILSIALHYVLLALEASREAALICVMLAFLIRSPLLTLARQQWVWREQKPETRSARLQVLVELLIMAIAAWQLVLVWPRTAVIGLGAIAGALNILAVSMTVHNRQREVWFQAVSAAGLSLSGIAACISLTGGIPGWAWAWWALHTGHFWTGIMVVHVRLQARIDAKHTAGVMSPALRGLTTQAKIVQGIVALAGLALIGLGYMFYGIAVMLSSAVHLRDIAAATTPEGVEMSMHAVGRRALVVGIVFTCLLIAGVWR